MNWKFESATNRCHTADGQTTLSLKYSFRLELTNEALYVPLSQEAQSCRFSNFEVYERFVFVKETKNLVLRSLFLFGPFEKSQCAEWDLNKIEKTFNGTFAG